MATAVDICNLALASLGDPGQVTSINPPDGSAQAGHCARWLPVALRRLYEEFDWSFAIKRAALTEVTDIDSSLYGDKNVFALPANCVRLVSAFEIDSVWSRERKIDFDVEMVGYTKSLITYSEEPIVQYIEYSETTANLPNYFVDCVVVLLASLLVGPLKRSDSASVMAQNLQKQYMVLLSQAKTLDSQQSQLHKKHIIPSGIRAREV